MFCIIPESHEYDTAAIYIKQLLSTVLNYYDKVKYYPVGRLRGFRAPIITHFTFIRSGNCDC